MSKKPSKPHNSQPEVSKPMFTYLRAIAFSAFPFSVGVMVMPEFFWCGVGLVYLSIAILLVDFIVVEKAMGKNVRAAVIAFFLGCAAVFSWKIAFAQFPLRIQTVDMPIAAPDQEGKVSGVKWKPEYYEVQVEMDNDSDSNYQDLEAFIHVPADSYIADVGQEDSHCDIQPAAKDGVLILKDANGKPVSAQNLNHAGSPWIVDCDKVRAKGQVILTLALIPKQRPAWVTVHASYKARFGKPADFVRQVDVKPLP